MKKIIFSVLVFVVIGLFTAFLVSAYIDNINLGSGFLVSTQNNDGGWEWKNPDFDPETGMPSPINTFGVTAHGLLESYKKTEDSDYLDAAELTASTLLTRASNSFYSQDIEFLRELCEVTQDARYCYKAYDVMDFFMSESNKYCSDSNGCNTASEMRDAYYGYYSYPSGLVVWQLGSWARAAYLVGETSWASDMADFVKDDAEDLPETDDYYSLGLGSALHALALNGKDFSLVKEMLLDDQGAEGCWDSENPEGLIQDTAYALMGLWFAGDTNTQETSDAIDCLIDNQQRDGSWLDDDEDVNTETSSEALRALSLFYVPETPFGP